MSYNDLKNHAEQYGRIYSSVSEIKSTDFEKPCEELEEEPIEVCKNVDPVFFMKDAGGKITTVNILNSDSEDKDLESSKE